MSVSEEEDAVRKVFDTNSRVLGPAAVGGAFSTMAIASLGVLMAFHVLRPRHKAVFQPKVKYHAGTTPPPRISDSIFGWIPPIFRTKESELLQTAGLDAVVFLRFLRLLRVLFIFVVVICCGVLIPINIHVNNLRQPKRRDVLSQLTIRDVRGKWLYAHVAATYLITFVIMGVVYWHWKQVLKLRYDWFRSPAHLGSFQARTLMVQYVHKKYQSDEGIQSLLNSVKMPYPTTSVHIGRNFGRLPELIKYHNDHVEILEGVLVKYLKGGKVASKRPTIRIGGFCGLGGKKVDAIEYYTSKIARAAAAVERHREEIDSRKPVNYGFASLGSVPYAHVAAKLLANKHPRGTNITLAPHPRDIIWENIIKSSSSTVHRKIIGFVLITLLCTFSLAPLFVVSALANLESLATVSKFQFLRDWSQKSPVTFTLGYGILPPVISALLFFLLPRLLRGLSKYMGASTHARLDRAVTARFFAFMVVSQLIVFTLIGVAFNSVREIWDIVNTRNGGFSDVLKHLEELPKTIDRAYINQASYWLKWFPLRALIVIIDLAQVADFIVISIKKTLFGRTPREIREWTKPREFLYAEVYTNFLFMAAVGLVFAPLAPLIAAVAMGVFWIASWVYKYQFLFVVVSKIETGGRLWNVVINRLLFCVVLMQALMCLTIGLQYSWRSYQWASTLPPILFMVFFKIFINHKFERHFRFFIPSAEDLQNVKVHSGSSDNKKHRLANRFGHPSLHAELYTPMLYENMMPLLGQVYKGTMAKEQTKLREFGGEKVDTQIMPSGLKIATVTPENLHYDPALYQRDRMDMDIDRYSMASSNILSDTSSILPAPITPGSHHKYMGSIPGTPVITPRQSYFDPRMDPAHTPMLHAASYSPQPPPSPSLSSARYSNPPMPVSSYSGNFNPYSGLPYDPSPADPSRRHVSFTG